MASFKIHTRVLKDESKNLNEATKILGKYVNEIEQIAIEISLGKSTEDVKRTLRNVSKDVKLEGQKLTLLSVKLDEVIVQYENAERNIIVINKASVRKEDKPTEQGSIDFSNETASEKEETIELIKTILGFIPGVNCIVDMVELLEDWEQAIADGNLTDNEIIGLVMDVGFLVLDGFAAFSLAKNIAKGFKTAKVASTAAKKATKTAAARRVTAEAAVAKTAKNSGKKVAEKAAKATRKANNAVKRAEAAQEAARAAKVAAIKESVKETAKDTGKNVIDKYVPTAENGYVPNYVKEDVKDKMIG